MQVQVLKKKKLREEGEAGIYVEQNHRPQLLYAEEDIELMQAAWELTSCPCACRSSRATECDGSVAAEP
jgi:hypothetical protein